MVSNIIMGRPIEFGKYKGMIPYDLLSRADSVRLTFVSYIKWAMTTDSIFVDAEIIKRVGKQKKHSSNYMTRNNIVSVVDLY